MQTSRWRSKSSAKKSREPTAATPSYSGADYGTSRTTRASARGFGSPIIQAPRGATWSSTTSANGEPRPPRRPHPGTNMSYRYFIVFVPLCLCFGIHAAHYYPFLADDALISLRYATRLCEGHGLTWSAGKPVEGYTDLLWVLLNVPAACLGVDLILSARLLGVAAALLGIGIATLPSDGSLRPSVARAIAGELLFACCAPLAVWAVGGLEHGFMVFPLALGLYLLRRQLDVTD